MTAPTTHTEDLRYSHELVALVNAEARHATWGWFPYAGVLVISLAVLTSAWWPWGFAA